MARQKARGLYSTKGAVFHIEVEGVEELGRQMVGLAPNEIRNLLRGAVHGLATHARDAMKMTAPKDTGALIQSIRAIRRRGGPNHPVSDVRVNYGQANAPYGLILEFGSFNKDGTQRIEPRPWIGPVVESLRKRLPQYYAEEFGKRLERALAKRALRLEGVK